MDTGVIHEIAKLLQEGGIVPYLGPAVPRLSAKNAATPSSPVDLVQSLTAKVAVPLKIRANLTAAAQFIEAFKHRSTLNAAVSQAFAAPGEATALHRLLFRDLRLPLVVHAWYDDLPQKALAGRADWAMLQGVSQAEHRGAWFHAITADGALTTMELAAAMPTVVYQPLGSIAPARNYLVSDSDFVEVLTEIDIQTPIPDIVQSRRAGRGFLFLGCRFDNQLERQFARQIIKRSSNRHWAILPDEPLRNEARFLAQYGIERIAMPLPSFVHELAESVASMTAVTPPVV